MQVEVIAVSQLNSMKEKIAQLEASLKRQREENQRLLRKADDALSLERTVKQLSKKVLQFSKIKAEVYRQTLQTESLKSQVKILKEGDEAKRELEERILALTADKTRLQAYSRRKQTQFQNLQDRYKRLKKQNSEIYTQNQQWQEKCQGLLSEFGAKYDSRSKQ